MALAAALPALAQNTAEPAMLQQLASEAGVSVEQAREMTLNELAALKINSSAEQDDRITLTEEEDFDIPEGALQQLAERAGISVEEARDMSLNVLGARGYDASPAVDEAMLTQLADHAGISVQAARSMSFNNLAAFVHGRCGVPDNPMPEDVAALVGDCPGTGAGVASPVSAQDLQGADADINQDQLVSTEEAAAFDQLRFDEIAGPGGEAITREQFMAALPNAEDAEADLTQADADESGDVSRDEWAQWRQQRFDEASKGVGELDPARYQDLNVGGAGEEM